MMPLVGLSKKKKKMECYCDFTQHALFYTQTLYIWRFNIRICILDLFPVFFGSDFSAPPVFPTDTRP